MDRIQPMRCCWTILALLLTAMLSAGDVREKMAVYETRYYTIYTDLDPQQARIAGIRMTRMAEECARRLSDFGAQPARRLPFYLFADPEDYYATGAPRESSGRFNGNALLIVARDFGPKTWHLIQHEGFHQFADAAINANLPPWVNEGLAEYFGEAVFTGDGFVTGAIPQWRLERIRQRFAVEEFRPISEMLRLPAEQWNQELSLVNYDQAWSMVQFLAHAEKGKYRDAFRGYLAQLARGQNPRKAWSNSFSAIRGFEEKWRDYWMNLPNNPTTDVYAEATVAALTSFLARACSQQQTFDDFSAFEQAARQGEIRHHPEDWLPDSMLIDALETVKTLQKAGAVFSLEKRPREANPGVRCTLRDGRTMVGRFALRQGRVWEVWVDLTNSASPAPRPSPRQ